MNKKFISALLAASLLLSAGACSNTGNDDAAATTTTPAATTTTELTSGTTSPEDAPESQPTTDEPEEDDADAAAQTDCQKLTDAVLKDDEIKDWATAQAQDEMLKDVMNYDLDLFDEYSVVTHLMSAHLIEITVVKPKDGQDDAALEFLNKRKDQLINEVAFYPDQQENAEKTIVGSYEGYCYLLCFQAPEALESTLKAAIDNLNA